MKIVAPKSGTYNASTCAKNLHEHVMAHVAEVNPWLTRVYIKVWEDDVVIPYEILIVTYPGHCDAKRLADNHDLLIAGEGCLLMTTLFRYEEGSGMQVRDRGLPQDDSCGVIGEHDAHIGGGRGSHL